jgi:hypothetical protein
MQEIDMTEVERRIGYWQHELSKIERGMMRMQSERLDVKDMLVHLQDLQMRKGLAA